MIFTHVWAISSLDWQLPSLYRRLLFCKGLVLLAALPQSMQETLMPVSWSILDTLPSQKLQSIRSYIEVIDTFRVEFYSKWNVGVKFHIFFSCVKYTVFLQCLVFGIFVKNWIAVIAKTYILFLFSIPFIYVSISVPISCCFNAWCLNSITHICCGYLYKTCTKSSQSKFQHQGRRSWLRTHPWQGATTMNPYWEEK